MYFFIEHENSRLTNEQTEDYEKALILFKAAHFGYCETSDNTSEVTLSRREKESDEWELMISRRKHLITD